MVVYTRIVQSKPYVKIELELDSIYQNQVSFLKLYRRIKSGVKNIIYEME